MLLIALALIIVSVYAIRRGWDVRLVLLTTAFVLCGLNGDPMPIVREFLSTFSNEKFVIPICTAMGFAYVLRHTQCDQHLVQLLVQPIRRLKFFLIPGVLLVGFIVNIPVISQTSTAVCIGAVVVPLMRAAGISPLTIGSTMALGASIGGELLNPGAPELNTVGERLKISSSQVIPSVVPLIFPHLLITLLIYWWLSIHYERRHKVDESTTSELDMPSFRVNYFRALVPMVPLVLLFLIAGPFAQFSIPEQWIVQKKSLNPLGELVGGPAMLFQKKDPYYETRLIGAAMLFGVLIAGFSNRKAVSGIPKAFFEGAGYAFAEIVSLIVVANCFGEAIKQIGLAKLIGEVIQMYPSLLLPSAGYIPLGFGFLSGSGMASTQSLYTFFVEPAQQLNVNPVDVGALVSMGAAAGRTMSPVAAVVLMSAKLTGTDPFQIIRRIAGPLLISFTLVLIARMLGGI